MSFSISFFARDVHSAKSKLREAYAPEAVKALIELSLAGIPQEGLASAGTGQMAAAQTAATDGMKVSDANRPTPRRPKLCGVLVSTHGHIDEHGGHSSIGAFRVEPYYD